MLRLGMSQKRWGLGLSSPVPLMPRLLRQYAITFGQARIVDEFHRVLFRKFPYMLIYLPSPDELLVVSFFHQHREPGVWLERFSS